MTGRRLEAALEAELARRDASAFVHAGTLRDPSLLYCVADLASAGARTDGAVDVRTDRVAVAYADGERLLERSPAGDAGHPASRLASRLADRGLEGTAVTPRHVPHDAACYLEDAGFAVASTDVLERARAEKTDSERRRLERAGAAAAAGVRRVARALSGAAAVDGRLVVDGEPLTADRLRTAADAAIVEAGGVPAGGTTVGAADRPGPGEPIVVRVRAREPTGYRGDLVRTFVVDGEGGPERRAHVALTGALESARALLSNREPTVGTLEAELEAEIRAFGFDAVRTAAAGVGLAAVERPVRPEHAVGAGAVVRLAVGVDLEAGGAVRLADTVAIEDGGLRRLTAPSRSLEPASVLD